MTLKKHLILVLAAVNLLSAAAAEAYIVPGDRGAGRGPGRPAPYPDPDVPVPGFPDDGFDDDFDDDFGGGIGGQQEQKTIYLGRRYRNEEIALRQVLNIDERFRGYTIESVVVQVRGSGPNSSLNLLINNGVEDSVYAPRGETFLMPRMDSVIGRDVQTLRLSISGVVDIDSVTVNLRGGRQNGGQRDVTVPLYVSQRMIGNDRLDLTRHIDMRRYAGYRIKAIEIEANALYGAGLIELLINSFSQGGPVSVGRYVQVHTIRPTQAILGQGADSLVLYTRGDLDIRSVTLRLSRR